MDDMVSSGALRLCLSPNCDSHRSANPKGDGRR